jgi:DnaJ-class molecular chaperone
MAVPTDPYEVLGVTKDTSQADIQKAYRRLAKKLHPDLNPGNAKAEAKFKDVTAAYDLLNNPEKRARFDRGEIDESGAERPQRRYYRDYAGANGARTHAYSSDVGFDDFGDFSDADDFLSSIFRRTGGASQPRRGSDVRYRLEVDFLDAINGATKTVKLGDRTIDVRIPPGTRDGQVLRLRGRGQPSSRGGEPGDAFIEISVRPHPIFKRKDNDIYMDLPITLKEAVLGGKVRVPTPAGPVTVTIPKGANTGRVLRIRGKGVPITETKRGDVYATLKVMLPDKPDPELEKFVSNWHTTYNPRRGMEA